MSNILWTKVKFARNLQGVAFNSKISSKSQADILKLVLDACETCGFKGERLDIVSDKVLNSLIANGKLENGFANNIKNKGFATIENASIQINGKNHIEIISKDLNLYNAYAGAKQVDKQLCNKLHFAYSDKYGFLSPDIKDIGSGMSVSALVMLPALARVNAVASLPRTSDKLRFNIECIDAQSGIYLISSGASLGYGEKQICELSKAYIDNVIKCEIEMSKNLAKDQDEILDKLNRAKAIINACVKMTPQELNCLIGDILIAINAGLEKDMSGEQVVALYNCVNNTNSTDEKCLAKIIKETFKI